MALYRCMSGGGTPVKFATGTYTTSNQPKKITLGFKPRILFIGNTTNPFFVFYNEDINPNRQYRVNGGTGANNSIPLTSGYNYLESIDDDGFTMQGITAGVSSLTYYAYGFETPT